MASRLREKFRSEITPALMQEFKYTSVMQVPHLEKIVLNIGLGEAVQNAKSLDAAVGDLTAIAGQKPVVTRSKKAIAAFKLRQGMPIGAMVTLRGNRMYDFFDRLVSLALPRLRDFRGISRRSFDGRGNYSLGLREQILFPEIDYDKVDKLRGLEVSMVTSATDDAQGYALLKRLGMPFRD
ncbi:MAG: 50S ribosomal protein L5 [Roseiflexaceae bacterium]|nr:50S ribosomal protein L5 [Roseiflexaceae bacterium]